METPYLLPLLLFLFMFPHQPASTCSTYYGLGPPCLFPYRLRGELYFCCTTSNNPATEENEGVVARCPTKIINNQTYQTSQNADDWGVCHTDCPFKKYQDNRELQGGLESLARENPRLAQYYSLGRSVKGQEIGALRVTKGADRERETLKPMVRLIANMHGNEVTGRELLPHLASTLVRAQGRDQRLDRIMKEVELHIVPSVNPDGWDRATEEECGGQDFRSGRLNENKVDLNRDFPVRLVGQEDRQPRGAKGVLEETRGDGRDEGMWDGRQPETVAIGRWALKEPWLVAANFHDGAVVTSYPWDHYLDYDKKTGPHPTQDQAMFERLANTYALAHRTMTNSSACLKYNYLGPIINGAAWYPKNGTLKDFTYQLTDCMELVIELSCCKFPNKYFLPREWDNNRESLLSLLEAATQSVRGLVVDLQGRPVTGAKVGFRLGRGGAWVGRNVTTSDRGEFWKLVPDPGRLVLQAWAGPCVVSGPALVTSRGRVNNLMVRRKFNCT